MRIDKGFLFVCILALAATAHAQEWEIGGIGGAGFASGVTVSSVAASATTGFKSGPAFGVFGGSNLYPHLSGELRYTYQMSDLKLTSGGTEVGFNGVSHAVHYDLVFHPANSRSKVQPFVAAGAGIKVYQGNGKEQAYQPLSNFAYLTHTQDLRPLISVGGGMKYRLTGHLLFRAEVRDYITPFPNKVITPAPGAKVGGWLQDFVPMFGLSVTF
jgi:outer membrane protein with beta-barrel domain